MTFHEAAQTLLQLVVTAAVAQAIAWARTHIATMKLGLLRDTATILVGAAEQTAAEMSGAAKKDAVFANLTKRFPQVDPHLVSSSIEMAVLALKPTGPVVTVAGGPDDTVTTSVGPTPAEPPPPLGSSGDVSRST